MADAVLPGGRDYTIAPQQFAVWACSGGGGGGGEGGGGLGGLGGGAAACLGLRWQCALLHQIIFLMARGGGCQARVWGARARGTHCRYDSQMGTDK